MPSLSASLLYIFGSHINVCASYRVGFRSLSSVHQIHQRFAFPSLQSSLKNTETTTLSSDCIVVSFKYAQMYNIEHKAHFFLRE